jgi:hypothetical protein
VADRESYLTFEDWQITGRRTRTVVVLSRRSGDWLGIIRWYGHWRQYAFFPADGTIWNADCLEEVRVKIRELMDERKKTRREQ